MAVAVCCLVLPSTYRDSVALMHLSQALECLPGVQRAAVMMGTPQNRDLLRQAGLLTAEGEPAGVNDLLICVQADTLATAERTLHEARQRLALQPMASEATGEMAPRTLETALRRLPEANLVCISVPGQYACHEARKALQHGLHVFLFSDHVELEAEEELKWLAAQQGLLVMGPDCGTAILGGVPLGFANQLPRGPVGLISASGTGLQQVACLLARQGIGVSQAIGVGGRDLHCQIGGRSMRAALQALAGDASTRVIVLISKPPDAVVAMCLAQEAAQVGKPCVLALLGEAPWSSPSSASVYGVATLEQAALVAGALLRGEPLPSSPPEVPPPLAPALEAARAVLRPDQSAICALYCGGTLAYEALWLLRRALGTVHSNLDETIDPTNVVGHVVLDLGAEEFTSGRPHPMIDPTIRRQQLLAMARRPEVAVVLCDVMLGWGAHADPAIALAAAWEEAQRLAYVEGRRLVGIASVCGTPDDPQDYAQQCEVLRAHGVLVAESNVQAVGLAAAVVGARVEMPPIQSPLGAGLAALPPMASQVPAPPVPVHLPAVFAAGPQVINLGLELFAASLTACGVPVVHVDWRPPAGGNTRLASLLARLR
jgi:FdrA protein